MVTNIRPSYNPCRVSVCTACKNVVLYSLDDACAGLAGNFIVCTCGVRVYIHNTIVDDMLIEAQYASAACVKVKGKRAPTRSERGYALFKIRTDAGMTQRDFAALLKVTQSTVSMAEHGARPESANVLILMFEEKRKQQSHTAQETRTHEALQECSENSVQSGVLATETTTEPPTCVGTKREGDEHEKRNSFGRSTNNGIRQAGG